MEYIKVFAPATVANVGCGFDIFGFAVEQPGDIVEVRRRNEPGLSIEAIHGDGGRLPRDPARNAVTVVMIHLLEHLGITDFGASITLHKNMALGSGMGSSAASSVAGVVALNEMLGAPLTRRELLPFAMQGELIAAGAAHADNVGPSLMGGFLVIRSYDPLDVFNIPVRVPLFCTLVHPDVEVNTKDARLILRNEVSLKNTITQMGNVAGLVSGLMMGDYPLISRSLVDVLIEPVRSILIPEFTEVKTASMEKGALGCSISGAGPSIFALSKSESEARVIGEAMKETFANAGINSTVYVSGINFEGPRILEKY